jgi:hypothetical protein
MAREGAALKTCARGHDYDPAARRSRGCPTCQREMQATWRAENPERDRELRRAAAARYYRRRKAERLSGLAPTRTG